MKKITALLIAVAFASVSGLVAAQSSPVQSVTPSVQATPDGSKAQSKAKAKKPKGKSAKKAKAR